MLMLKNLKLKSDQIKTENEKIKKENSNSNEQNQCLLLKNKTLEGREYP